MHIYQKCSYFKVRERKQTQGLKKKAFSKARNTEKLCSKSCLEDKFPHEKFRRKSKTTTEYSTCPANSVLKGISFVMNVVFRNKVITLSEGL